MTILKALLFAVLFFGGLALFSGVVEFLASIYWLGFAFLIVSIGSLLWYAIKPERNRH